MMPGASLPSFLEKDGEKNALRSIQRKTSATAVAERQQPGPELDGGLFDIDT